MNEKSPKVWIVKTRTTFLHVSLRKKVVLIVTFRIFGDFSLDTYGD